MQHALLSKPAAAPTLPHPRPPHVVHPSGQHAEPFSFLPSKPGSPLLHLPPACAGPEIGKRRASDLANEGRDMKLPQPNFQASATGRPNDLKPELLQVVSISRVKGDNTRKGEHGYSAPPADGCLSGIWVGKTCGILDAGRC